MDEELTTPSPVGPQPAAVSSGAAAQTDQKVVERKPPEVDPATAARVKEWIERIEESKEYWKDVFDTMRETTRYAAGRQWPGQTKNDDRYVANITLRHINQRVASIYAKNPRVRAVCRQKMYAQTWDGSPEMLHDAMNTMAAVSDPAGSQAAIATGQAPVPTMDPGMAQVVVQEATEAAQRSQLYRRMALTLEHVAQYSLDEPVPKFKTQAKQLVRRVLTTRVGYLKLGYQRTMGYGPDVQARLKDTNDRLEQIKRLAADTADGEIMEGSAEADELRRALETLQAEKDVVIREGLTFSFPKSWSLIIDPEVTQLKGFVNAEFIAEEYIFTPKQVQKIYGVDVGQSFNQHSIEGKKGDKRRKDQKFCAVYEVHDVVNQQVFTVCSGYQTYLRAPANEDIPQEQIHPYFALTFNDVEATNDSALDSVYPPSDAELLRSMQAEYNRSRESLRVHRIANRPATVSAKGVFPDEDKLALANHADHENIQLNISKNDDIEKLIKPKPTVPIQPELYDVEHVFIDTQRVVGDQAANLGGTSGSTATESTIAENSRVTTLQSNIDDLDEFLTDVMRAGGQVLLKEMGKETVVKIVGPGAVWPELSKQEVQEELYLEIRAGSSGRPNKQARLQAIEKTFPLLLQVPGVKPRKLAEFMLNELDEGIELDEFIDESLPSITAQNAMAKPNLSPRMDGTATAAQGKSNGATPTESPAKTQNLGGTTPGNTHPPRLLAVS